MGDRVVLGFSIDKERAEAIKILAERTFSPVSAILRQCVESRLVQEGLRQPGGRTEK